MDDMIIYYCDECHVTDICVLYKVGGHCCEKLDDVEDEIIEDEQEK